MLVGIDENSYNCATSTIYLGDSLFLTASASKVLQVTRFIVVVVVVVVVVAFVLFIEQDYKTNKTEQD